MITDSESDFNYEFPPVTLMQDLGPQDDAMSRKALLATAEKLRKTLYSFGVQATVENVSVGPAITRYELAPAAGVRVSKIANLSDDIALNYTNTDFQLKEDDLNKYDYSNIPPDDPRNQRINTKILFKGNKLPEKISNYVEPEIRSKALKFKYCLGLSVNSMNNIVFNKNETAVHYVSN